MRCVITARVRSTMGRYCFHRCLSVRTQGGFTSSPSHNTSTRPMSFLGVYPSDWSQVPSWGYPSPRWEYPILRYPPGQGRDTPPSQGWGTYPPPPGIGQQMEYLICGGQYASCVHAGGLSC